MVTKPLPETGAPRAPSRPAPPDQTVARLAGGVAQDFNTLFTLIIANLELLDMQLSDPRQRGVVARALEAAQLGGDLNRQLLALAAPVGPGPARIDLRARLAAVGNLTGAALRARIGIRNTMEPAARAHPDGHALFVAADRAMLDRVLLMLMVTVCDAMPEGGRIALSCARATLDATGAGQIAGARPGRFATASLVALCPGARPEAAGGAAMTARRLAHAAEAMGAPEGDGAGQGPRLFNPGAALRAAGGFVEFLPPSDAAGGQGPGLRLFLPCDEGKGPARP